MRIVIATDGSPAAVKAARQAAKLAARLKDPPWVLVLAVDPPLMNSVAIKIGPTAVDKYHAESARFALRGPCAALRRAGIAHEERAVVGDPAKMIARTCASAKADLLVMGSHGRGAARSLFLGSVTLKVLASTATPTLIVR